MDRRTLLAALASGIAGLAGCADGPPSDGEPTTTPPPTRAETPTVEPTPATTPTDTPTETPSHTPTEEPPTPVPEQFRLVSIDAPSGAEIGESVRYRFTVENTSGRAQPFEPTVSSRSGGSEWTVRDRWDPVELSPGERHTFESPPIASEYLSTVELRIDGFGTTFAVEFSEKRLRFSEAYRDPLDRVVSVSGVSTRSSYRYTTDDGERCSVDAGEGSQWVFADVRVENRSNDPVAAPGRGSFTLLADEKTYPPIDVRGDREYEPRRLPGRETARGVVGYKTPDTLAREAFRVRWRGRFENGEVGVVWSF